MTASRKREGASALDSVKTKQRVEAKSAAKAAGAKAAKASGDSPKRQGDKLERARDARRGARRAADRQASGGFGAARRTRDS